MALYQVGATIAAADRVLNVGDHIDLPDDKVAPWQGHIDAGVLTVVEGTGPNPVIPVDDFDDEAVESATVTEPDDEPTAGHDTAAEAGDVTPDPEA